MPQFRLRRRDPDAPEWVTMEQVYYGELDRQPGSEHVWLHHPAGPHAGKYVSAIDDVQLVD